MHVDTTFTQQVFDDVLPYLDNCKYFYTEIDFSELNEDMNTSFIAPSSLRLRPYIGDKKYTKLRSILLKSFNFDIEPVSNLRALIIINMLAELSLQKRSNMSLDMMLSDYAISKIKQIGGIETVADQISIMTSFDERLHIRQLLDIGRNPSKFNNSIKKLNTYYIDQDILSLYHSSKKGLGKLRHKLLYDRNTKMTQSIHEKALLGSSFFAFGAGHFSGKYGILRQLKQNGAIITPISLQ